MLIEADRLWQRAETLAADEPEISKRVKLSRMSIDYAVLERARLQAAGLHPVNTQLKALAVARFEPFFEVLEPSGLTRIREWTPLDVNDYRQKLGGALGLECEGTD